AQSVRGARHRINEPAECALGQLGAEPGDAGIQLRAVFAVQPALHGRDADLVLARRLRDRRPGGKGERDCFPPRGQAPFARGIVRGCSGSSRHRPPPLCPAGRGAVYRYPLLKEAYKRKVAISLDAPPRALLLAELPPPSRRKQLP